jgi:hypothetical protein
VSARVRLGALNIANSRKTARFAIKILGVAFCNFPGGGSQRYTPKMTLKLTSKSATLVLAFCTLALTAISASAQWQWVEKDGRKIFSDRAPPAGIPDKDILKRPAGATLPATAPLLISSPEAAAGSKPVASPAAKASAPKLSGKDTELEAKKKKAEEEEAAKKKAEEEKVAKAKAENCERAKSGLATIQSGVRLSAVNAKGEREVFDDARRASESKRAQEIIDSNCK